MDGEGWCGAETEASRDEGGGTVMGWARAGRVGGTVGFGMMRTGWCAGSATAAAAAVAGWQERCVGGLDMSGEGGIVARGSTVRRGC